MYIGQGIQEWTKKNLWNTVFKKIEVIMIILSRPYNFKFFKGCLSQILLDPFSNIFTHITLSNIEDVCQGPNKPFWLQVNLLYVKITETRTTKLFWCHHLSKFNHPFYQDFWKTNISYLLISTCTCAYRG